jgi:two-component system C4-dicarboxylate transport response regulator DctD
VALLFFYFAERAAARFRRQMPAVPASVHRYLSQHDWPGNVRELAHFAERFVLGLEEAAQAPPSAAVESDDASSLPERLERYEADVIRETLGRNDGDVRRTIEALGIPRKTFYDKLQRHGIVRSDFSR